MRVSKYAESHVKNLLLWLRELARASGKARKDESYSDAADLIEELAYDVKWLQRQLAAAKRDGERLEQVRELVFCYTDNEITDHPWWAVVRKSGMGSSAICAGPFFSRERAEECCEARRHEWGKGAFVFGFSGYRSEHYKTLRDLLDPDKKLRIKSAARQKAGE